MHIQQIRNQPENDLSHRSLRISGLLSANGSVEYWSRDTDGNRDRNIR